MAMAMHFQYIPYIWILLVSAAIAAGFGIYAWHHRSVPGAVPFAILNLTAVVWAVANALEMAGTDLPTKIFWANVQYLCYGTLPLAWLALVLQYTGRGAWLTRRRLAWLAVEPAIAVVLVWTNAYHGLIRQDVYLDTAGPFPVIGKTYGPWFWINVAYAYCLFAISIYLSVNAVWRAPALYRRQRLALLVGFLLPLVWNVLYNLGLSPIPRHDLAPAVLSLSGVVVGWALFRFRLFDIVPIAQDRVIEGMDDGMIVLDLRRRIVDLNPAAQRILGWTASQAIGKPAAEVFSTWPALIELCQDASITHTELASGMGEGQRLAKAPALRPAKAPALRPAKAPALRDYDVHVSSLADRRGHPLGQVIVWHEITDYKRAQAKLLQQQRALAVLGERERLARELHDDLAQVLGYANVQAQAVRELLAQGQIAQADLHLARLAAAAQDAHADAREYILGVKVGSSPEQDFLPTLAQYLQRFGQGCGLHTELIVPQALEGMVFDPAVEVQLLRIIQEALTNVRKHACAHAVRVSFAVQGGQARIVVEDDGRGFDPALLLAGDGPTFGLHIMRERAEETGGNLQVVSAPGQGTQVIVQVPLREGEST
jgi:signal transduction histidine kinase